jgi:two-component system, NtrC family, sensor kinase
VTGAAAGSGSGDHLAALVSQARLATIGMFVAGIAHEINTPMGALTSNHDVLHRALGKLQDILADEIVEPHELEEVRRIVRAVNDILQVNEMAVARVGALVRSLRDFGRIDNAPVDFADLHQGLDGTLAILAHQLRHVTVDRDYGEMPAVECRPEQINQVFMNLLVNAAQATPEGGHIIVRTSASAAEATVQVVDTGRGIEPQHMDRIFEPGFTTKDARIGMGLGLLISRQIVEAHGGRIGVDSQPGRGATFTVRLPLRQPGP